MPDRLPTVSVVVPCYRYGRFLPACVDSVLSQEGVDVRVLIIDDASPDDSADVAHRLAAEHDRVEVQVHEVNRGHIATYNEGLLDWATGDYSVLISADDLLTPGSLARAVAVLEQHPSVGFVYGHAINWTDTEPQPVARDRGTGVKLWKGDEWLRTVCLLGHTVVSGPAVVVRTSVQQAIGGYLAELPHTGDVEMWMRFAVHSDVAYLKGVDQAHYRIHGNQMTVERVPLVDLRQRKAAYDVLFERDAEKIADVGRLRSAAEREMAKEALWRACRAYERRRLDSTPVLELEAFAHETYAGSRRLPEYWGLRWRRLAGPKVTPWMQPIMMSAVHRKVRKQLWWRRWAREGY